jgi:hypothetical protein
MYEMGLSAVDDTLVRAVMIDDLYNMDWGKGDGNEAYADELAGQLESFWIRGQAQDQALAEWREREVERVRDELAGAPPKEAEPMPTGFITPREHAQMRILSDQVARQSQRMRELTARRVDFGKMNDQLLARIHVVSIEPKDPACPVELKFDADGVMTVASLDDLRDYIGDKAYRELVRHIDRQYSLAEAERKNSDSLPGKPSPPSGSTEASGESASSDGNSTE